MNKLGSIQQDEINEVLGSQYYFLRYYFKDLRERALGPYSKDLVQVTRFYMDLKPQVVVDFEPPPPDKFHLEVKRYFFMEKGIIYIPIYLGERLSKQAFQKRFEEEKEILARGYREALENQALFLKSDFDIPELSDPAVLAKIDAEALKEIKDKGLRGAAKNKHLKHIKERLLDEVRQKVLNARLESDRRDQPASVSAGG